MGDNTLSVARVPDRNHYGWFKKLASTAPLVEPVEGKHHGWFKKLASAAPLVEPVEDVIEAVASVAPIKEIEGLVASIAPLNIFDDSSEEDENRAKRSAEKPNGKSDNGKHYGWFKKLASAAPLVEPVEEVIEAIASVAPVKEVEGLLASIAPLNIFDDSSEEHDFLGSVIRAKRSDVDHEKPNGKSDNGRKKPLWMVQEARFGGSRG
uniref:Uncharacterized protein n=1 Tax=Steinernema glaseri TaxID=37863 RepID=A0A1I7YQC4_9BILA